MPSYTLSSGESFQTIRLPKGTILFRGIDLYTDKPHPEYIFSDLFGYQDEHGYYCVDPHENKFFYPAPFVSDSVNRFAIHVLYHINYDIEIVLMVKPSENARCKQCSAYLRCTDISHTDKCSKPRASYDPCLSPLLIKEYPHIQGFIAIAEKDADIFKRGQIPAFMRNIPEAVEFIRPFIVSNSRKIHGIPEIVLFPYHARPEYVLEKITIHPHAVEPNYISYAIANRPKLNYFPLVYVTEKRAYSFKELLEPKRLYELASTQRNDINFDSVLISNLIKLLNNALSPGGFSIGHTPYKFTIDTRTGFYVLDMPEIRRLDYTIRKINVIGPDHSDKPVVVPFYYPLNIKKKLHASFSKNTTEEALEGALNKIYGSYSKHYVLDKGIPVLKMPSYRMDLVLPRPELDVPRKRYTLKQKRNVSVTKN